jgi:hypothetical protein
VTTAGSRVVARYLRVPVDLYLQMQAHNDAVGRDLVLAVSDGKRPEIAVRLTGLLGGGYERLSEVREELRGQVEVARAAGRPIVDIETSYRPEDVVPALAYLDLVEEADVLAAQGVIFVPDPGPAVARIRRWFTIEMDNQVRLGRPPTPFPG